jgi:hypothetical protein
VTSTRSRKPQWPDWTAQTFTTLGMAHLERVRNELKSSGLYARGSRLSCEDIATSAAADLRTQGRGDLVKLA